MIYCSVLCSSVNVFGDCFNFAVGDLLGIVPLSCPVVGFGFK